MSKYVKPRNKQADPRNKEVKYTKVEIPIKVIDTDWDSYVDTIYRSQITEVISGVASGKTTRLICELVKDYSSFPMILVLTPTKVLVEGTYNSLIACETGRAIGRSYSGVSEDGDVVVSTYGKYLADMIAGKHGAYDLIVCDEFHTASAEVQFLVEYFEYMIYRIHKLYKLNKESPVIYEGLVYNSPPKIALLTATPGNEIAPRSIRHKITEITVDPKGLKYRIDKEGLWFYGVLSIKRDYDQGAVIACVSIREANELSVKWNEKCKTAAYPLTSETSLDEYNQIQEQLPLAIIFATDTIRSGVNLDIESIVLPGVSYKPQYVFKETSPNGYVDVSKSLKLTTETEGSHHQYAARVGRVRPGIVYQAKIKFAKYDRWAQSELKAMLYFAWFDIPTPLPIYTKIVKEKWFNFPDDLLITRLNVYECVYYVN